MIGSTLVAKLQIYCIQNRRQKEKRLPLSERRNAAKNARQAADRARMYDSAAKSIDQAASQNTAPPSSRFMPSLNPSSSFQSVTVFGQHSRASSMPADINSPAYIFVNSPAGSSSALMNGRPSTLHRSNSAVSIQTDLSTGIASLPSLVDRMPEDPSSPVKASDAPALRRTPSFTLEWAAAQSALKPSEAGKAPRPKIRSLSRIHSNSLQLQIPPARSLSYGSDASSPSLSSSPALSTGSAPGFSLSDLLQAAQAAEKGFEIVEEREVDTDEEAMAHARQMNGDQSFSSVSSVDAIPEADRECAAMLLGLFGAARA